MIKMPSRRSLLILLVIVLLFLSAGAVCWFFLFYIPSFAELKESNQFIEGSLKVPKEIYPSLLDLGKFFLTLVLGVFVASITFSEKIVNFMSSSWWAKFLLIFCWLLLLLSIVSDGVGLVYLSNWYGNTLYEVKQEGMLIAACICFSLAGISFGVSLTSMFAAGVISFLGEKKPPTPLLKPARKAITRKRFSKH